MSILLLCFHANLLSKDFGVKGQTFPILEKDIRDLLSEAIDRSAGRGESLEKAISTQLTTKPANLEPHAFLKEAKESRSFLFDPSIILEEDIKDTEGNFLAKEGDRVNPLEKSTVDTGLLFFDGDQTEHVAWAKKQERPYKWILVKGNPLSLEQQENRPVYFDQNGVISKRFQLKHIPCRINQKGDKLLIEEEPVR